MAARQAVITVTGQELGIRDHDSPGGTFVNQQRLLSGQSRRLQTGDVIQLGSVHLRVTQSGRISSAAPATKATPPPLPSSTQAVAPSPSSRSSKANPSIVSGRLSAPFLMASGSTCRTWDDFLVLAAQQWRELRDELTSGRLSSYLKQIQRSDLVPRLEKDRSLDEQLDQWLAQLPTSLSKEPELDVYPDTLNVRAVAGGGVIRQTLRITNVGYRLLRATARIEPPNTPWIRLSFAHDGHPLHVIEQMDMPVELLIPETMDHSLVASIILDGNGGNHRVLVKVEPPSKPPPLPESAKAPTFSVLSIPGRSFTYSLSRAKPGIRIGGGAALAIAFRSFAVLAVLMSGGGGTSMTDARLPALSVGCVIVSVVFSAFLARPRGDRRWPDTLVATIAGGLFGIVVATVYYALIRTAESPLAAWSPSLIAIEFLWGLIGASLAALSCILVPYRSDRLEGDT